MAMPMHTAYCPLCRAAVALAPISLGGGARANDTHDPLAAP